MTQNPYVELLPVHLRPAASAEPEQTWWAWREHRVHLARARRPESAARLLVVHGAGAHGGALWPLASLLAHCGVEVAAVDLPLYGLTATADPESVTYADWVDLLVDLVAAETATDDRPVIVLGASIGGLLALETAARQPDRVAAVAATCLLDPEDPRARARMTRFGRLGGWTSRPLAGLARGAIARRRIPMRWVADVAKMSLNPEMSTLCARDPRGGAARVPLGFLASYLSYSHTPPETITTPVLLVHPSRDEWTPVDLSARVVDRLGGPSEVQLLRGCGHFPLEEPGIQDLMTAIDGLVLQVSSRSERSG